MSYRDDMRSVDRQLSWTAWKIFKWGLLVLLVLIPLGWIAQSTGIISMNIHREVVQHSQQYVETKVNLLNKLHNDWLTLDSEIAELRAAGGSGEIIVAKQAQQRNTLGRMRTEADMIPDSQVPASVRSFLSTHSR